MRADEKQPVEAGSGSSGGDERLVAAARAGDREAFAALVERHYGALLAACRRLTGDRDVAADAAQEAVLAALLGLSGLRRDDRFGPWLLGIARNVCRSVARPLPRVPGPAPEPGPDELAEASAAAEHVRAAVAGLPPGQRAAVTLFHLCGLSHAETAERLGVRTGSVKTRLHKGRASLRRRLSDLREETMTPVEMRIADVRRSASGSRHAVVLHEEGGHRRLPIWIGAPEATALAAVLEGVDPLRPGPYQLAAALLEGAGRWVRDVRVCRLLDAVFYALVVLDDGTEIDARPSDALTLAALAGVPVSVEAEVLSETERTAPAYAAELAELEAAPDGAAALADEERARQAERRREVSELAARAR
jgi:RNA polymerase sigma factor (sigma-70 family)